MTRKFCEVCGKNRNKNVGYDPEIKTFFGKGIGGYVCLKCALKKDKEIITWINLKGGFIHPL